MSKNTYKVAETVNSILFTYGEKDALSFECKEELIDQLIKLIDHEKTEATQKLETSYDES